MEDFNMKGKNTVKNPLEALLKHEVTFDVTKVMKRTWKHTVCQFAKDCWPYIILCSSGILCVKCHSCCQMHFSSSQKQDMENIPKNGSGKICH
jgi:hypothetical protein